VPSWQTTVVVEPGGTTTVVLAGGWDDGTTTVVFSGGGGLLLLTQPESAIAASINAERIFMITPRVRMRTRLILSDRPAWRDGPAAHALIGRLPAMRSSGAYSSYTLGMGIYRALTMLGAWMSG
jgi:hypothetical protein